TKKGEPMAFLSLSDENGDVEVVVFPKLYKQHPLYFEKEQCLLVEGKVQKRGQSTHLIANKAIPLDQINMKHTRVKSPILYLKNDEHHQQSDVVVKVNRLLKRYRGNVPVILYYVNEIERLHLPEAFQVNPADQYLPLLTQQRGVHK